jgi:Primase C terminal 1 (PriCT-1)
MSDRWLPLLMSATPLCLRALGWIGFRARRDAYGRWKKEPYQIGHPQRTASNNKPDHWRTEGDVRELQIMAPELFNGFGVALPLTGGLTFIDLDHVRDRTTGAIAPWAIKLVDTLDSWTEISVSGEGLHVFCLGALPGGGIVGCIDGDPLQKVEVYDRARFAYLTGNSLHDPPRLLVDRQRLVTLLAQHVRPPALSGGPVPLTDDLPVIPDGQRNDHLFRIARGFVRRGLRGLALEAALVAVSHRRCVPVPPDADVIKIARHAERLPDRRTSPS